LGGSLKLPRCLRVLKLRAKRGGFVRVVVRNRGSGLVIHKKPRSSLLRAVHPFRPQSLLYPAPLRGWAAVFAASAFKVRSEREARSSLQTAINASARISASMTGVRAASSI